MYNKIRSDIYSVSPTEYSMIEKIKVIYITHSNLFLLMISYSLSYFYN